MVQEEEVVVMVSFVLKSSSLFSFDLLFVAFDSFSFCGDSGADVVVVEFEVVALVVVAVCVASLAPLSSFFFGTGFFSAAASLNFLHTLRCPPFFQLCIWHSRPQYCTVRHNLQGCKGRNGVLGLPQVEQQRIVGVVRPSCLSNC